MYFRIALLTIEEWKILSSCYVADKGVYLYFGEQGMFKASKPGNWCNRYININKLLIKKINSIKCYELILLIK